MCSIHFCKTDQLCNQIQNLKHKAYALCSKGCSHFKLMSKLCYLESKFQECFVYIHIYTAKGQLNKKDNENTHKKKLVQDISIISQYQIHKQFAESLNFQMLSKIQGQIKKIFQEISWSLFKKCYVILIAIMIKMYFSLYASVSRFPKYKPL